MAPRPGKLIKTKGARGQNPRPRSSFGFASDAIEVRGPVSLDGVVLKIALDAERLRKVEPATLRIFCFDATSGEWQLVPRSGARAQAGYAWAHLQTAGTLHRNRTAGWRQCARHGAVDSCADAAAACGC